MAKKLSIIGNGPSRDVTVGGATGDICICNIPQIDVDYDFISIIDTRAHDYIKMNKLAFDKPIYTTEEIVRRAKQTGMQGEYIAKYKEKLMNNAATAAYWFSQDYDEIYLFGCDALWSNNCSSHQDTLIPRPQRMNNLHNRWREFWSRVWATGKQFYIVHPNNIEVQNYGSNVNWINNCMLKENRLLEKY